MPKHEKQAVAMSSVLASALLTVLKLVVGLITGSIGILSEAAHSALDFGATLLTFFAVRIGDQPADTRHPYGHGKVENVSALIETGLLFLTSAWIIYEAVRRLSHPAVEIEATWYAFAVMFISIVVDFSRSRALNKVAQATGSQALEADALHFSSDILSSLVVLSGLLFVLFGINRADTIAAIGVSFFVLRAGFSLGRRTIDVLVDTAPEGLTEKVIKATNKVKGIISIEKLRVRPVGVSVFIDMIVTVSRKIPLAKTHDITNMVEKSIRSVIKESDITIHAKPIPLSSESLIEQIQIVANNQGLAVHDIVVHSQDQKKYASFDLEVDANLTIKRAHTIASKLEKEIINEIGNEFDLNIHIEPFRSEMVSGRTVKRVEAARIVKTINQIIRTNKLVKEIHDIKIRQANKKLFITLHCLFDDGTPLEKAHGVTSRLEYLIREQLPDVARVVVHAEPITSVHSAQRI